MKKALIMTLLAVFMFSYKVNAESGTCGDDCHWELVDGVMTISGSGTMDDYTYSSIPWHSQMKDITKIVIEDGIQNIGNQAFEGASSLTSLTIPNSVTSIGIAAFSRASSLTELTIPDSVTSIGQSAFSGASGLTSLTIPASVTSIGDYAFYGASSLTSLDLGNGVQTIGNWAFGYHSSLSSLTSLTIPASVTSIGDYAFMENSLLESVTFEGEIPSTIGSHWIASTSDNFTIYYTGDQQEAAENAAGYTWKNNGYVLKPVNVVQYTRPYSDSGNDNTTVTAGTDNMGGGTGVINHSSSGNKIHLFFN